MANSLQSFTVFFSFLFFIIMLLKLVAEKISKTTKPTPKLPPGPWKLPLIGNIHQLISPLPHHRLRDLATKHGPLMRLQLGEVPHIVVSSPEIAKEIMTTHDVNFSQRPPLLIASKYYGVDVVFGLYEDNWRTMRRICQQEMLSPKAVKSFRQIREREVSHMVQYLYSNSGSSVNLSEELISMTYSITAMVAFGRKCKDQEAFISNVQEGLKIAAGLSVSEAFPSYKWLHWILGAVPKFERNAEIVGEILDHIIEQFRAERSATSMTEQSHRDGCILDVLLDLEDGCKLSSPMENEKIKAFLMDIFIAGSDATSVAMEWAMLEMLKNPRVLKKAQAEVRQVYGKQGNVDETSLHELKYLKLVIKETLRLHPSGPLLIPRESKESCVVNGFYIPSKTKVIVNGWAIGRDSKYWTEAEKFYPERFIDNSTDFKGTNFEFIPFGAGRRICPGILFATTDIELSLSQLLFHFDWKLPDGASGEDLDLTESFGMTVRRNEDLYLIPIPYYSNII